MPVSSITAVGKIPTNGTTNKTHAVKKFGRKVKTGTKETLKVTSKASKAARNIAYIVAKFKKLSSKVFLGMAGTKAPSVLLSPFTALEVVDDVKGIVVKKGIKEKIRSLGQLIVHSESLADAASSVCAFLAAAKFVSAHVIKWIPIMNIISYVVSFISLAIASYDTHKARRLLSSYKKVLTEVESPDTSDARKAELLSTVLADIEKDIKSLRTKFSLGKYIEKEKKKETLQQRVSSLREQLLTPKSPKERAQAVDDAKLFMKKLAARASLDLRLKAADISITVGLIAGLTLLLIPTPPTAIAGLAVLATTSIASLVMWGGRIFFVNRHPFDPEGKSRAKAILDAAANGIHKMRVKLSSFATSAKALGHTKKVAPELAK